MSLSTASYGTRRTTVRSYVRRNATRMRPAVSRKSGVRPRATSYGPARVGRGRRAATTRRRAATAAGGGRVDIRRPESEPGGTLPEALPKCDELRPDEEDSSVGTTADILLDDDDDEPCT